MYDNKMINTLANKLRDAGEKSRGRGLRINLEWLMDVLDDDDAMARLVLERAGYEPPAAEIWTTGRGEWDLDRVTYAPILADTLTNILDAYDT